ncbi:hypothetical protein BCT30_13950 [Enterovibrio norvegicus]|uniref:DUF5329 family protein n=1 Tax=Enterovibrio norvegicus TaxID=188144 RepID=UPI000C83642B|nr:DUF5329 family protein [Enterovibrio norvegicus]MCC4800654.1 DUF5329 domain-containing protein [Enterovibrio norvegicus]PMH67248.1 hypothetical protein BCU62_07700 [Enterovibrio norvegicus]PMI31802.1 hypothetical protein BCU47_14595 [Enterovibrio norvegicus]PMI38560.1 hypothetical protein BCU46_00855 [Enterovibrio norvegicus]PMN51827.1 hypothetical protein BCT30_13950 [Enterovibrio norvegicus]
MSIAGVKKGCIALSFVVAGFAQSAFAATTSERIEHDVMYLISQMEQADCTFVRNGKTYTNLEVAEHLLNKWDYAKDDIESTTMFIDEVASKSWFTGKAYKVKCGGDEITSKVWLTEKLADKTPVEQD